MSSGGLRGPQNRSRDTDVVSWMCSIHMRLCQMRSFDMQTCYLDHAATSWPKPASVLKAFNDEEALGGSPGRGAYAQAHSAAQRLFDLRQKAADVLGVLPCDVSFPDSATTAANICIFGFPYKKVPKIVLSQFEHTSVTRPVAQLKQQGAQVYFLEHMQDGTIDLACADNLFQEVHPDIVVCQHANNVCGCVQPIAQLSEIAHAHNVRVLCDASQAFGHIPSQPARLGVDAWWTATHKALMSLRGAAMLWISPELMIRPLRFGGTGFGDEDGFEVVSQRPDGFEVGTLNLGAIHALAAALDIHIEHAKQIYMHEQTLLTSLVNALQDIEGIRVLGAHEQTCVPVVSFVSSVQTPDTFSRLLDEKYHIATRAGVHCSPTTHTFLHTRNTGAVRMSIGAMTTSEEIAYAADAVLQLQKALS